MAAARLFHRRVNASSADYHRLATKLGIAKQFDGRKECIHIEMGNALITEHPYSISTVRGFMRRSGR